MEISFFLAKLIGLTLMVFTLVAMIRPMIVTVAMRDLRPFSFVMLAAGFLSVLAGLALIISHNVWELNWRGVVTLFGWAVLAKGILYVGFPETFRVTAGGFLEGKKRRMALLSFGFLLGAYLTYNGFGIGS
jgi:hypothetical protein